MADPLFVYGWQFAADMATDTEHRRMCLDQRDAAVKRFLVDVEKDAAFARSFDRQWRAGEGEGAKIGAPVIVPIRRKASA